MRTSHDHDLVSSLRVGMCEICALMHANRLSTFRRQDLRGWALLESGSFSPHRLPRNCHADASTVISKLDWGDLMERELL